MEITIQSVNFETSDSLNAYITKKLGKLNRFTEIRVAEVPNYGLQRKRVRELVS